MRRGRKSFMKASLNRCNSVTYKLPCAIPSLLIVGTVAFDAIETPFGKTDKILGGAGTYIGLSAAFLIYSQP
jgi:hypothetical protein